MLILINQDQALYGLPEKAQLPFLIILRIYVASSYFNTFSRFFLRVLSVLRGKLNSIKNHEDHEAHEDRKTNLLIPADAGMIIGMFQFFSHDFY